MIATLRLFVCAGAIALAGSMLEFAHPGWIRELATDLCALPNIRAGLYEELELGDQLEVHMSALGARAEAKQRILKDLIGERLTLVETASRFRELDKAVQSDQLERLGEAWPGRSVVERYCHQIIQTAAWELSEQPCVATVVAARLKKEFKAAAESGAFRSAE
jgi:hypothetical protein